MGKIQSICNFIPTVREGHIQILNFVRETDAAVYGQTLAPNCFKLHAVISGTGVLCTETKEFPIAAGDVFLEFPGRRYTLRGGEDFSFIYISFIGLKSAETVGNLNITPSRSLFPKMNTVSKLFSEYVGLGGNLVDIAAEGALFYALTEIGKRTLQHEKKSAEDSAASRVKRYLDEHFTDRDLTLERLSLFFSYHPKYISRAFVVQYGIGIAEYLKRLRIEYADSLIARGFSSVKDIATLSGFSDPLYFSRLYKRESGIPPTDAIRKSVKP